MAIRKIRKDLSLYADSGLTEMSLSKMRAFLGFKVKMSSKVAKIQVMPSTQNKPT